MSDELKMVMIEWLDSVSSDGGWTWQDDWVKTPTLVKSMGFVIEDTKNGSIPPQNSAEPDWHKQR